MTDILTLETELTLIQDAQEEAGQLAADPTLEHGLVASIDSSCSSDGEPTCGESGIYTTTFDADACIRVITLQSYLPSGELGNFSTELDPNVVLFPGCFDECDMSNEFSSAKLQQIDCSGNLALTLEICTDETTCAPAFSIEIESGDLEYIEDQDLKIEFKPLPEFSE